MTEVNIISNGMGSHRVLSGVLHGKSNSISKGSPAKKAWPESDHKETNVRTIPLNCLYMKDKKRPRNLPGQRSLKRQTESHVCSLLRSWTRRLYQTVGECEWGSGEGDSSDTWVSVS